MYQLEDRILFDGAAVFDAAAAAAAAQETADAAAAAEPGENGGEHQDGNNHHDGAQQHQQGAGVQVTPEGLDNLTGEHGIDVGALGDYYQKTLAEHGKVNILLVSSTLENADALIQAADSDTIIIKYDAHETTAAQLIQQLNEALDGEKADSIGFLTAGEDGSVEIFADGATTLDSLHDQVQQDFWSSIENMLSADGRVDLFASNVASGDDGKALVDAIADLTDHTVAASDDVTGDADAGGNWALEYVTDGGSGDVISEYFDVAQLDSFDHRLEEPTEVVFIESSVAGKEDIINSLGKHAEVVILDPGNGFDQITEYLADRTDIDSIHIFSHGNDGFINLGDQQINADFLQHHADDLAAWGDAMTEHGDILLYGCNVAETDAGQHFVDQLAHYTGADVAASDNAVGAKGDWVMEYTTGAIEAAVVVVADYDYSLTNWVINSIRDIDPQLNDPGEITLRYALANAADGDLISFAALSGMIDKTDPDGNPYAGTTITINAELGQFEINNCVTINGSIDVGNGVYTPATINAADNSRVFYINATPTSDGTIVNLQKMIITGGHASTADITDPAAGNGGGVYITSNSEVNMWQVQVEGNRADLDGGGIYNTGKLTFWGQVESYFIADIMSNVAGNSGGGIFNSSSGDLYIYGHDMDISVFSNTAENGSGGAIYSAADFVAYHVYVAGNSAVNGNGGGIAVNGGTGETIMIWVDVADNRAGNGGGISYEQGNSLSLYNCRVDSNTALQDGGGIYFVHNSGHLKMDVTPTSGILMPDGKYVGVANIENSVSGNEAVNGSGGGLYIGYSGDVSFFLANINNNFAYVDGGGIYMANAGDLALEDSELSFGRAGTGDGGGIWYDGGGDGTGTLSIKTSMIAYSLAGATGVDGSGGGIYQIAGSLLLENVTMAFNAANLNGGAVYLGTGTLSAYFVTFAYNGVDWGEGAQIYVAGAAGQTDQVSIVNTIIYNDKNDYWGYENLASQIRLSENRKVVQFENNIYSHYYLDSAQLGKYALTVAEMGGAQKVAANRLIGSSEAKMLEIQQNLYLDTELKYHANYRTKALAILYKESWAYTGGIAVSGIDYDQRGNNRVGYGADGKLNEAPSIGAFEPIFYVTVNSKDDDSRMYYGHSVETDGFVLIHDDQGRYLKYALQDGMTLREAMYWMDTYDRSAAFEAKVYDGDRFVKFDSTVFSAENEDNIIQLKYGAVYVVWNKEIMVSSVAKNDPNDPNDYNDRPDNIYWSQDVSYRVTVDGGKNNADSAKDQVFYFSRGTNVILNNLNIQNGFVNRDIDTYGNLAGGGGIYNLGRLVLNNILVVNNEAHNTGGNGPYSNSGLGGGIYNGLGAELYLYDTTVRGNSANMSSDQDHVVTHTGLGGGIYNEGLVVIERSNLSGNKVNGAAVDYSSDSAKGGGIYNLGQLYIANTTIAQNEVSVNKFMENDTGSGAAIYNAGGLICSYYNTIVYNTSVINNPGEAADGKYDFLGAVAVINGELNLSNTILAYNRLELMSSPAGLEVIDLYVGDKVSVKVDKENGSDATHNVIGGYRGSFDWSAEGLSNIVGDSTGSIKNLNLDTEMRYNGGLTKSYRVMDGSILLGAGSVIVNAAPFHYLDTDQRHVNRDQKDRYGSTNRNIGSYESLTEIVVKDNADIDPGVMVDGYDFEHDVSLSDPDRIWNLREALQYIDADGVITFDRTAETWTADTIALVHGQVNISHGILIDGNLGDGIRLTIEGNGDSRIFNIASTYTAQTLIDVTLANLILTGGSANGSGAAGNGGAIYAKENLTLSNVLVDGNKAANFGGGIFSAIGSITLKDGTVVSHNTAYQGGGLYVDASQVGLKIDQSMVIYNTAAISGGGIYLVGADSNINRSTIGYNTATQGNGGGIYSQASDLTIVNSTLSNNTSGMNGGAIAYTGGGQLNINFATIANNVSGTYNHVQNLGGGLYQSAGELVLTNSVVAQNYTTNADGSQVRSDLYIARSVGMDIRYSALGVFNFSSSLVNGADLNNLLFVDNPDKAGEYAWSELKLDTVLTPVDGGTMIVTVFNGSALIGKGNSNDPVKVAVDQNGAERPNSATIGAVEMETTKYIYQGDLHGGGVYNLDNWLSEDGRNPKSWDNATFVIDGALTQVVAFDDAGQVWGAGKRTDLEIINDAQVTIADDAEVQATAEVGDSSSLVVLGLFNGAITINDTATLTLTSLQTDNISLTVSDNATDSTVIYNYAGTETQTVLAGNYGNLTLTDSDKACSTNITVNGDLTMGDVTLSAGSVVVYGNVYAAGAVGGDIVAASGVVIGDGSRQVEVTLNSVEAMGNVDIVLGSQSSLSVGEINTAIGSVDITLGSGSTLAVDELHSAVGSVLMDGGGAAIDVKNISAGTQVEITNAGSVSVGSVTAVKVDIEAFADVTVDSFTATGGSSSIVSESGRVFLTDVFVNGVFSAYSGGGNLSIAGGGEIYAQKGVNLVSENWILVDDHAVISAGRGSDVVLRAEMINLSNAQVGNTDKTNTVMWTGDLNAFGDNAIYAGGIEFDSDAYINVSDYSSLFFYTGQRGIELTGDASQSTGEVVFDVNNITVADTGTIGFVSDGAISLTNIAGTAADGIRGTLLVNGSDVIISDVEFNYANLIFEGNITLRGDFLTQHDVDFRGNVKLDAPGRTITVTSEQGSVSMSGTVEALNGEGLVLDAETFARIGNMLNLSSLEVHANDAIYLNGVVRTTGAITLRNDVVLEGDSGLYGQSLLVEGDLQMDHNLTVNVNDGRVDGSLYMQSSQPLTLALTGALAIGQDVVLSCAAGATFTGGRLDIGGDFRFDEGRLAVENGSIWIRGSQNSSADRYFMTNGNGLVYLNLTAGSTADLYIGDATHVTTVTLTAAPGEGSEMIGVGTFTPVTDVGTPNGGPLFSYDTVVNRVWTIVRDGSGLDLSMTITPDKSEIGQGLGDQGKLFVYRDGWKQADGLVATGSYAIGLNEKSFDGPYAPHGLNAWQFNDYSMRLHDIMLPRPKLDEGERSWQLMSQEWRSQLETNPLGGQVPPLGTTYDMLLAVQGRISLTDGLSVYGSPLGPDELGIVDLMDLDDTNNDPLVEEATDDKAALEALLSELAEREYLQEKHPAFRSDVDRMLDMILAS